MGSAGAGAKKGVQFVAVDEEWFRKMKEEEAREEEVKIPSHLGSGSSGKGRASEDVQVLGTNKAGSHGGDDGDDEDEVIRLILRIKGMEDFKIKVKSDTTIQKILSMLTSQRPQLLSGANAGKKVVLRFDGEDVDEDGVVADVDCEDMDVMDVFIR
ncbi:hypothetical protein BDZ91DRAFT_731841 [Kalaharituber pfeilii]|nr:hypothetical protein BDZ91DRAFT_731841 [Kalaharituber pfeilii]